MKNIITCINHIITMHQVKSLAINVFVFPSEDQHSQW